MASLKQIDFDPFASSAKAGLPKDGATLKEVDFDPFASAPDNRTLWEKARPYIAPTIEAIGGAGGGILGAATGTMALPGVGTAAGAVGGAGLGLGIAREALELGDVYLGGKAPRKGIQAVTEPIQNVVEGATYEAAGPLVGKVVGKVVKGAAKGAGRIADIGQFSKQKAAEIARNALGLDLGAARNALAAARPSLTAGQATSDLTSPAWQALVDRSLSRDPRFQLLNAAQQQKVGDDVLNMLAGGGTKTEVLNAQLAGRNALNKQLIPKLDIEMTAANTAGKLKPGFDEAAERMAGAAAGKVEDVRRFTAASDRAKSSARVQVIERGLPVSTARYTYTGELAKKAEEVAAQAAEGSLAFGEAARFSKAASDSLASHGLKPLKSESIISKIRPILSDPKYAENDIIESSVSNIADGLKKWTDSNGVIDAWALDSIRKNSINATIAKLRPGLDQSSQKRLAAEVTSKIKPAIVNAIVDAGGTGYPAYLKAYEKGAHQISEKKLMGEAADLFKTDKQGFIDLVRGNKPETVERIFGSRNFDISKELTPASQRTLEGLARQAERDLKIVDQSAKGQDALRELLMENMTKWRLPSYLSVVSSTTNKALDMIERRIGHKTMGILTEAMKSGKSADDLLATLPGSDRVKFLKALKEVRELAPKGAKGAAILATQNSMSDQENRNAMSKEP